MDIERPGAVVTANFSDGTSLDRGVVTRCYVQFKGARRQYLTAEFECLPAYTFQFVRWDNNGVWHCGEQRVSLEAA